MQAYNTRHEEAECFSGVTALMFSAPLIYAQTSKVTGHVVHIDVEKGKTPYCHCAVGDTVTVKITLKTYFTTQGDKDTQKLAIYPLTVVPREPPSGLSRDQFDENRFVIKIGTRTWINQIDTTDDQLQHFGGSLQLSNIGSKPQPDKTYNSIFTNGFVVMEPGGKPGTNQYDSAEATFDVSVDSSSLWNTTGDNIFANTPRQNSRLTLRGQGYASDYAEVKIDHIESTPTATSQVDPNALLSKQQKAGKPLLSLLCPVFRPPQIALHHLSAFFFRPNPQREAYGLITR